jgi:hypothetical protein
MRQFATVGRGLILTLVVLADPAHPEFAQEVINENEVA